MAASSYEKYGKNPETRGIGAYFFPSVMLPAVGLTRLWVGACRWHRLHKKERVLCRVNGCQFWVSALQRSTGSHKVQLRGVLRQAQFLGTHRDAEGGSFILMTWILLERFDAVLRAG